MPSKTSKQRNFMAAVAHSPEFAKKVGVPQSVGKDFNAADKGRKFAGGGEMKESKEMMKKEVAFMKKKGAPKSMIKHEAAEAKGYKAGGAVSLAQHAAMPASKAHKGLKGGGFVKSADGVASKGKTKGKML